MGEIRLKVHEAEGTVVIEVSDNGAFARTDLRPDVLEGSLLDTSPGTRSGLAAVRDRLRHWGGDLLVDSDEEGTTVRALLPTAAEQPLPEKGVRIQPRRSNPLPD
jgi:signal transduction histidine kinase